MPERYSYDRTANGPGSRIKDAGQILRQSLRDIERVKGILHGLASEIGLTASHTRDRVIQDNLKHVQAFAHTMDDLDQKAKKLAADLDHFGRNFK